MSLFETIRDRTWELPTFGDGQKRSGRKERSLIRTGWLSAAPAEVAPGEVYRHEDPDGRHEIATVVQMCEILDMPHVKYTLRIERPNFDPFEGGERVINLKSFRRHFSQQINPDEL